MIIKIKSHFDAAHSLPSYSGECSNLHGHTWRVEVGLNFPGFPDEKTGMYADFKTLKREVETILQKFDHTHLNTLIPTPTAENIAFSLRDDFGAAFQEAFDYVEVWESDSCGVRWE